MPLSRNLVLQQRHRRPSLSTLSYSPILSIIRYHSLSITMEDDRRQALQLTALAERYMRAMERSKEISSSNVTLQCPTPQSSTFTSSSMTSTSFSYPLMERYLQLQKQRGLELLESLRRRDDHLTESVVDLSLGRRVRGDSIVGSEGGDSSKGEKLVAVDGPTSE